MPRLIAFLLSGLIEIAGSLLGRVLLGLGLGFVEYMGLQTLFNTLKQQATVLVASFGGFPEMLAWAGFLRIDVHISIIISAVSIKMVLSGLMSDKVRRLRNK